MRFSGIIGHEKIKSDLSKYVGQKRTFLFYGSPSIGKRTIASLLAKYDLCRGLKEDDCTCPSCTCFNDHPDYLIVGNNGKILVKDVDNVIDFVSRLPLCSETKVVIIDNIDVISIDAANRLLKTLEESPFVFFLITSQIKNVLPTIRSRCLKIHFESLSQDDLINVLWKKMGFELTQARIIGWIGAGSGIDIFSSAGLYIKNRDLAISFLEVFLSKDRLGMLDFIDKINKIELSFFIDMLTLLMTDMLVLKFNMDSIVNSDKRDELKKLIKNIGDKNLVVSLNYLTQVKMNMHLNINLNLALKAMVLKIWPILKV